ncbi:TetR/AcrR family transcriptional regulator [Paramicrobacterium chengjingii]|uniref:TetR/AcrR family transcriptional regulator n=1 Tax=Paramicrobacterium chengjingii TaxID=2769067 RepID=A0ABX6YGY5_9MICO|nr:TetR/AcrR family transcriptional regulator [Microbacterium chengjingii]QPZ37879.1 TetR/AcrR family transcriptional regulator [Microbacterium chengjingii]
MSNVGTPKRRGPYAKSAERRRSIVDAAFEVFASRGYRGGSLQDVADRVGLSQTSLLHYFPSKADLLVAVLNKRDAEADTGPIAEDGDFETTLVEQARFNESVPGLIELYSVLCGESVTTDYPGREYFVSRFARLRGEYSTELVMLREQGRLRAGVDPERAASSIVALWDGIQLQWLLDPSIDMAACLKDYLDSIILPEPEGAKLR